MDEKTSLLEQLRIDRAPPEPMTAVGPRRTWIGLLVGMALVVLASAGGAAYWKVSQARTVPVQTAVAQAGASSPTRAAPLLGSLLDATGYVVALRDASVSAKGIYKVNEILVQRGESVKAGQVIARLDDSNVRAALGQSQMQVEQARAALAAARLAAGDARPTFLRQQKELAEGLISPDAFDRAKAAYDAAQAAVRIAQETLGVDEAAVVVNQRYEDDTVIRAPFDGVVTAKNAQPGQIVSPQFLGGGGLAEIVDMSSLEVNVDVSENFISRVHPHQSATITLDAYPEWRIPAEVIAIIPTADKTKATVEVRVGFRHTDPRILPQMSARVSFLGDANLLSGSPSGSGSADTAAVTVPSAAVESDGDSESGTVFVIHGNTVAGHPVRLGARNGGRQWILSGVDPGARVAIAADFSRLHNGVRIRIIR